MKLSPRTGGIALAVLASCILSGLYIASSEAAQKTVGTAATPRISLMADAKSATNTHATSASVKTASSTATSTSKVPTPKGAKPLAVVPVSPATQQARNLSASGGKLLHSLVNIVCLSGDPSIPSISGSGVIVDSRGIILTAAHVAQLFLLQDYLGKDKVTCLIRTGSPARRAYYAEPIYISQSWLKANPSTLTEKNPKGTGQYDVALLAITDTATSTPLPSSFPATPLASRDPQPGEQMAIGSYGAQYLDSSELNYALYPILIFGGVEGRYTYDTSTVDVVTVNGSAASQEGSSGGGIVTSDGQLIGTITTSSIDGDFGSRLLNAVTVGHLRRSFAQDMGKSLDATLASESTASLIADFKSQASILGSTLNTTIQANKH